jgi:hypothetical protein
MPAHDDVPRPVHWPGRPLSWPARIPAALFLAAAGCVIGVADTVRLRERRLLAVYVVLLALAAGAFLAIFAKNGLLDWGAYED